MRVDCTISDSLSADNRQPMTEPCQLKLKLIADN